MRKSARVTDGHPGPHDARDADLPERAQVLCELGRFTEAAAAAGQTISDEPRNARAWCLMAQAQLGQDRPAAALGAAQAAASLAPDQEAPYRLVSLALEALGRDEEAAAAAAQATTHAPHSWRAHARLAQCLAALAGRLPEARRAAERARELEPEEAGPHLAVGRVALAGGQRTEATSAFCAAIGADPQCTEAHIELSTLQSAAGPSRRRPWSRLGRRGARGGRDSHAQV